MNISLVNTPVVVNTFVMATATYVLVTVTYVLLTFVEAFDCDLGHCDLGIDDEVRGANGDRHPRNRVGIFVKGYAQGPPPHDRFGESVIVSVIASGVGHLVGHLEMVP